MCGAILIMKIDHVHVYILSSQACAETAALSVKQIENFQGKPSLPLYSHTLTFSLSHYLII